MKAASLKRDEMEGNGVIVWSLFTGFKFLEHQDKTRLLILFSNIFEKKVNKSQT
jgi:hypothetical protein